MHTLCTHEFGRLSADELGGDGRGSVFARLQAYYAQGGQRFYELTGTGIRFKQYVGVLQLGNTTLEVYPKLKGADTTYPDAQWQQLLTHMLRVCGHLPLHLSTNAQLAESRLSLIDLFYMAYLNALEPLLHRGLTSQYRMVAANQKAYKGKLCVAAHLRHNLVHQERVYVRSQHYDHDHLLNHALRYALHLVHSHSLSPLVRSVAQRLLLMAPPMETPVSLTTEQLDGIRLSRKTASHAEALALARLIIRSVRPSMQQGQAPLIALMFDMNLLWESYVYHRLRRMGFAVRAQRQAAFWQELGGHATHWHMYADLVLQHAGATYVLDTKWKLLPPHERPAIEDLRQMYAYNDYFAEGAAAKAILIYPTLQGSAPLRPGQYLRQNGNCHIAYWPLPIAQQPEPTHADIAAWVG